MDMDLSAYRQRVLAELDAEARQQHSFRDLLQQAGVAPAGAPEQLAPATEEDDLRAAIQVFRDRRARPDLRLAALQVISLQVFERQDLLNLVLEVARDASTPSELRLEALDVLEQTGFLVIGGAGRRPDYLEVLRTLVDDPDPAVAGRAISVLAKQKDEYVQRRLLEGLRDPSRALVAAAKAIQYLGYDVHAEHFPVLRQIVANAPDEAARKEAVRLLAADPGSRELLVQMLNDKSEQRDIRNMSALALQSVAPDEFEQQARRIVLDDADFDEIRSTAASALAHFANPRTLRADEQLRQQVQELREKSSSPDLQRASEDLHMKLQAEE
ncbi:MAG: HEAT repeat domain-containing protein [Chloroflexota bacterium]|nr:HEAT repeat domain-containing protein [Chloroflexota bacterium]